MIVTKFKLFNNIELTDYIFILENIIILKINFISNLLQPKETKTKKSYITIFITYNKFRLSNNFSNVI